MQFSYRKEVPDIETRRNECRKYDKYIESGYPIIFEKDPKSNIEPFPKTRYLVNKDMTVNHFQLLLRNKLKLNETQAFFLLVQGKYTILGENTLEEIYHKFKDRDDGFLYMMYSTEQIWG